MSDKTNEIWKAIDGYEGHYEVSNLGRVRSLDRIVNNHGKSDRRVGKIRVLTPNDSGHLLLILYRDGVRDRVQVHRLVALAFLGHGLDGQVVCHRNGQPADNHVENLYWGTLSENMRDAIRHGTNAMARKTHCIRGHEFTPENTYTPPGATSPRACRECSRARSMAYKTRKAA